MVTCGRETTLPSESRVLVVQMFRGGSLENPQRFGLRVTGTWGWSLLMTVCDDCPLWQEGSHSHHWQMKRASEALLGSLTL